jgi:hypothetical protein
MFGDLHPIAGIEDVAPSGASVVEFTVDEIRPILLQVDIAHNAPLACAGCCSKCRLSVALVRDVKDPWVLEIVNRTDAHNFVVLPKRWIVERTVVWITRNRRLMRDFER